MATDSPWKIHGEETVAAYLPDSDFRGLLERRIAVPPDHLAILIRDGEIALAEQGAHFSVGGLWQRTKEFFGGKHSLRMLVADLKPFPVTAEIGGWTRDKVEVEAEVVIEFQLDPERPLEVMGLVSNNSSVTQGDIFDRLAPHMHERDLVAEITQHDAAELRANAGLLDRIQAQVMKTCERIAGDMGLLVRAVAVNWAMTEEERDAIAERKAERAAARAEFDHKRQLRELERARESTTFQMQLDLDVQKAKEAGEFELDQLLLNNNITLEDIRDADTRKREIDQVVHEIELARKRRMSRQEELLSSSQNDLERKKIELAIKKLEMEANSEARRIEMVLHEEEETSKLRLADKGWDGQHRRLEQLQELELQKAERQQELRKDEALTKHSMEMEAKQAEMQAELDKLRLQSGMTEDQILALQAGGSDEVARVFAERAKASQGDEKEALLREMLAMQERNKAESAATTAAMFDKAMDRMADVATGNRSQSGSGGSSSSAASDEETVECPKCRHKVPTSDRFCNVCGHQMRT